MEFITTIILYGFIAFVIGGIGKLIYEVQQNKKKEKEADYKKQFQKLAGIGQPKNELDPEIWKYIADKVSKEGFPEPDKSIPITTATITTIGGSYGDSDPLASVPMSRVSKEAKKKMAEIAKEDIKEQVEKHATEFETKPKRKSNPKQMDGIKTEGEFKKTRKKTTKKKTNE
jgi:hypothetical protein